MLTSTNRQRTIAYRLCRLLCLLGWLVQPGSPLYGQSLPEVPQEMTFAGIPIYLTPQSRLQIQQEIQRLYTRPRVIQADISALRQLTPLMAPLFSKAKLSDDFRFVALPFSDVDTLGYWGLSRPYAQSLRLRVDTNVDERFHPILSSEAVITDLARLQTLKNNAVLGLIRYLKGNTSQGVIEPNDPANIIPGPQSPPLLWKILARKLAIQREEPTYRPATNYILYSYPYGEGQSLRSIATRLRIDNQRMEPFNQWLKTVLVPTGSQYTVLIPVTPDEFTAIQAMGDPGMKNVRQMATGFPVLVKLPNQEDGLRSNAIYYQINNHRGIQAQQCDNFITLAYNGDISIKKFLKFNDLSESRDLIRPGQIYYLQAKDKRAKVPFHVTQRNQTLLDIATIYGVRLESLTRFNRMTAAQRPQRGRIIWLQTQRPLSQPVEYVQLPPETPTPQLIDVPPPVQDSVRTQPRPVEQLPVKPVDSVRTPVITRAPLTDSTAKAKIPPPEAKRPERVARRDTILIEMGEKRKWHLVKPGQTYYSIANLYGITLQQLYTWNKLSEKIPLQVGQQLVVSYSREKPVVIATKPSAQTRSNSLVPAKPVGVRSTRKAIYYTVHAGETLYRIALNHNVSVKDVLAWNNMSSATIEIGQILIIWK